MSWIETIPRDRATGRLRAIYQRIAGPGGSIDNILRVHGLRPHTLEGHMALYKAVLHHTGNRLPRWVLESVGVHVSRLNGCAYCVDHHAAGLRRLLGDAAGGALIDALDAWSNGAGTNRTPPDGPGDPSHQEGGAGPIDERLAAMLTYATRLTLGPAGMVAADVDALRAVGMDDGEVLELNQVVSYFAYANRTVQGLGVTTRGDVLGLSPGNQTDESDWAHT
ncbi:MAG: carboxymuconolactone decarboxylase family protein [Gemmatimonadetes bacterium]|nr:carboxymuconolactone decarboxylase family protein [Gemmatimonadota bacterium]